MQTVTRYQYYIDALKAQCYKYKAWTIRAFSIIELGGPETDTYQKGQTPDISGRVYPYKLFQVDGQYAYHDPETREVILIEDSPVGQPLLYVKEALWLTPDDVVNLHTELESTCGRLLYNYLAIIHPFGDAIDYVNEPTSLPSLEKTIVARLEEAPKDGLRAPGRVYVDQIDAYYRGTGMLGGLNTISVPSATERTLTPAPGYEKVLDELLERHKDELNDPVVLASIWKQIEAIDRKYIAEDPDGGFYQSSKYFDVVRKKMLYMYGEESKFDGTGIEFIKRPLREGIDISKLPTMVNSLRDGSHNRGAMTALGGEAAKDIFRAGTGSKVSEEDCGTKHGIPLYIRAAETSKYVGNTIVQNGKSVLVTDDTHASLANTRVTLRSPSYCEAEGGTCVTCMGQFIRGKESAVTLLLGEAGNEMMSRFMAKMHGTALETVQLRLDTAFS